MTILGKFIVPRRAATKLTSGKLPYNYIRLGLYERPIACTFIPVADLSNVDSITLVLLPNDPFTMATQRRKTDPSETSVPVSVTNSMVIAVYIMCEL